MRAYLENSGLYGSGAGRIEVESDRMTIQIPSKAVAILEDCSLKISGLCTRDLIAIQQFIRGNLLPDIEVEFV